MRLQEKVTVSSKFRTSTFGGISFARSICAFVLVDAYTHVSQFYWKWPIVRISLLEFDGRCKILPSRIKIVKPDARRHCGAKRHKALPTSLNYDQSRPLHRFSSTIRLDPAISATSNSSEFLINDGTLSTYSRSALAKMKFFYYNICRITLKIQRVEFGTFRQTIFSFDKDIFYK